MARGLIAGNWKMNGLKAALAEIEAVIAGANSISANADLLICPPSTLIGPAAQTASGSKLAIGGQTCHGNVTGAHTGDVSAPMLVEVGVTYVIVGHSERRADHGETNEIVNAQAAAAIEAGLIPIICIGESREEREAGQTEAVILGQLEASTPVSASGA
ncbi:MAG: triose-phosphate isomerase, partial [Pseudomonadota bacterium]